MIDIQDLCINLCDLNKDHIEFIERLLVSLYTLLSKCEIGEELTQISETIKLVNRKRQEYKSTH